MIRFFISAATLSASACTTAPQPGPADCPIISSSDWAAWVNAMPGPSARPTLIVTGKAIVPTGGYRFQWGASLVAESHPVQVTVELQPVPPAGMATQAIVTHDIRGEWPSEHQVGSVRVVCGGRQVAAISPVETAH